MTSEQRYFDALKRIGKYHTSDQLRKHAERDWGLSYEEALAMAYENVISEARTATNGRRRPKEKTRAAKTLEREQ